MKWEHVLPELHNQLQANRKVDFSVLNTYNFCSSQEDTM